MSKDGVVQTIFKVSNKTKGESLIFDVLSKCENKTDLIKNALFHYIINIQNGNIIDRAYPYNEIEKYTELGKERIVYSHGSSYNYINNINDNNNDNNINDSNDDDNINDSDDEEYDDNMDII